MRRPEVWLRLGLRARLILIGTVGVALGLGAGGVVLVWALNAGIQRSIDDDARDTGRGIALLLERGALPQPLHVSDGYFVQIVDSHHRVYAASINADKLVPLLRESEMVMAQVGRGIEIRGERVGLSEPLRVVAVSAGTPQDPQVVIVARSLADVRTSRTWLSGALLIMYPLLVVVLAVVGWRVAGAALAPVEALRRGAERITGAATAERLPVPTSRDEIHRLAVTLNTMLHRLESSREKQRVFVADAAHELRSPLASMRTQLEVEARLGGDRSLVTDLLLDVLRLSRLVDDLLILARVDDSYLHTRAKSIDLAGLLADLGQRYSSARVPVIVEVSGQLWTRGHCDDLTRVMINLIDNAVRYASTRVTLIGVTGSRYHVISVSDDGPGIPAEDRERVFDRFVRLDDGRARGEGGSGLGLAIVREIVVHHGGEVVLRDAVQGRARPGLRADVHLIAHSPLSDIVTG